MFIYLLSSLLVIRCNRLSLDSDQCKVYLEKFTQQVNEQGVVYSNINLSINAYLIKDQDKIYFNISYNDSEFLQNATYFGLVKEDGKTDEETCLDLKIIQYQDNSKNNGTQLNNLEIEQSCSCSTKQRTYSFFLNKKQLSVKLIRTINSFNFIIKGYFGIMFSSAQTGQIIQHFPYNLLLTNKNQLDISEVKILKQRNCKNKCSSFIASTVKICSSCDCTNFLAQQQIYLQEYIILFISLEKKQYYIYDAEIYAIGTKLNKQLPILKLENRVKGEARIQTQAIIAWQNVQIQICLWLSDFTCSHHESASLCALGNFTTTFEPITFQTQFKLRITCDYLNIF